MKFTMVRGWLAKRKGAGGLLAVLGVAVAVAVIVFPLARWHASLTNSAEGLKEGLENTSVRLEMLSAMEDRWHQINDMDVAEFKNLTTGKETKYGKFTVKEEFGAVGKYNSSTGKCDEGTPGDGDRACRVATLTVTSDDGVSTLGPVQAIRVASSDDRLRNLEAAVATARATADNAVSKFSFYYTKEEIDAKISQSGSSGTSSCTVSGYRWELTCDTAYGCHNGNYSSRAQIIAQIQYTLGGTTVVCRRIYSCPDGVATSNPVVWSKSGTYHTYSQWLPQTCP